MILIRRRSLIAAGMAVAMSFYGTCGSCPEGGPGQWSAPSDVLQGVVVVKGPLSALAQIIRDASESLQGCPTDEASWYELIRAAEMRMEISAAWRFPAVEVDGKNLGSLAEAAAEAVRRAPESPRIALIYSRIRPEKNRVAALVERFPDFTPLRLSLAQAQLNAGQVDPAAASLENIKDLKTVPGAIGTLAAIRLAQSNPNAALAVLAQNETPSMMIKTAGSEAYERASRIARERAEVGFRAHLQLRHPGAALRPLLDATALGSQEAREILGNPDKDLKKAIAAARRSGKLNAADRSYLKK